VGGLLQPRFTGLQPWLADPTGRLAAVRSGPGGRSAPGAANCTYRAARAGLGAAGRRRRTVGAPGGGLTGGGSGLSQRGRSAGERKGEGGKKVLFSPLGCHTLKFPISGCE
jgi:hypothetical protein